MYFGQAEMYDRKIRYLDFMENGVRSRGAGFVKLERRDNRCNISLQVSGLYRKDHFTRPLLFLTRGVEKEFCKLQLADGGIKTYLEGLDCQSMDGQGLSYDSLVGLRIPISEGKEIRCIWEEEKEMEEKEMEQSKHPQDIPVPDLQTPDVEVPGNVQDIEELIQQENRERELKKAVQEIQIPDIRTPESRRQPTHRRQEAAAAFKEDKWEQIWAIYPHIHPFGDEREYLSFGLSDLVVLPEQYYRLVSNSFLLHGYYNFHHLILTKVNFRGIPRYFIGVPGNLYQTEKDTAIMFGFENFECDKEPAGRGDFGYYLIRVDL